MKELVSIIIPAYNSEKFIAGSLESVINQSHRNLDIIVIDDGSQDNTAKIVEGFVARDSRVRLFSITNHGVCFARNVGLDNMLGDYFAFLDSDDFLDERAIEKMLSALKNTDSDICYAQSVFSSGGGRL